MQITDLCFPFRHFFSLHFCSSVLQIIFFLFSLQIFPFLFILNFPINELVCDLFFGCCTKTLKHLNDLFFYGFMAIQIEIVHGTSIFVSPLFGVVLCPYCHNTYTAIMPTLSLLLIYFLCWPFVELLLFFF